MFPLGFFYSHIKNENVIVKIWQSYVLWSKFGEKRLQNDFVRLLTVLKGGLFGYGLKKGRIFKIFRNNSNKRKDLQQY